MKDYFIFEISWEVCNKVGGIYTVVSTKAAEMVQELGENYIVIGPYFMEKSKGEFQEASPPEGIKALFSSLEEKGIICHWGKWLVKGEPTVILIDFKGFYQHLNFIKGRLWEEFQVDSLGAPEDFNAPVLWSWCVGEVLSQIKEAFKPRQIIAHAHEWLSGAALLYLKKREPQIKKVFTTHATVLGRSLAAADFPLYDELEAIEPDKKAYELGVAAKHQLEKAIARNTDILTTVSQITSLELEYFLGRKPEILLPNGLGLDKSLTFEDISLAHRLQRDRMREFLLYYFFPYYSFDLRKSLFYFIAGRYEFHNKGIDLFIDALGKLNQDLKSDDKAKTVIAFFWVPVALRGIKTKIIEAREIFAEVEQILEDSYVTTRSNLLYNIMAEQPLSTEALFEKDVLLKLKRTLLKLKEPDGALPPLCAYNLADSDNLILKRLQERGLMNRPEDKVKVVVYPAYLTGTDGLLNLSYTECVQGSHLGVFPSYYEPWGYTPLETAALGVANITTDLAGFGRFIKPFLIGKRYPGIFVINRYKRKYEDSAEELSKALYRYSKFSYYERVQNKIRANELAQKASWRKLIKHYIEAYNRAVAL